MIFTLDDQFKYDFTEWNILLIVMYSIGIFLVILISKLIKQAVQDQQAEDALDFMVKQAEEYDLYNLEYKSLKDKKDNA